MRKIFYIPLLLCLTGAAYSQNADLLYFNQLALNHNYEAASFVIDTALPSSGLKTAFLLWSNNYSPDSMARCLSLGEFAANGNFISEHANLQKNVVSQNLLPKKIIKSRLFKGYYLL